MLSDFYDLLPFQLSTYRQSFIMRCSICIHLSFTHAYFECKKNIYSKLRNKNLIRQFSKQLITWEICCKVGKTTLLLMYVYAISAKGIQFYVKEGEIIAQEQLQNTQSHICIQGCVQTQYAKQHFNQMEQNWFYSRLQSFDCKY